MGGAATAERGGGEGPGGGDGAGDGRGVAGTVVEGPGVVLLLEHAADIGGGGRVPVRGAGVEPLRAVARGAGDARGVRDRGRGRLRGGGAEGVAVPGAPEGAAGGGVVPGEGAAEAGSEA